MYYNKKKTKMGVFCHTLFDTSSCAIVFNFISFLVRRLRCSSGNLAAESGMSQESPSPYQYLLQRISVAV